MMPTLRVLSLLTIAALGAQDSTALGAQDSTALGAQDSTALGAQGRSAEPMELTQVETERRVKDDMARRVRLRAEDVRIVESGARVWPDAGLGCIARRGVFEESREPTRVPGFEIVAEAGGRRFVYHTDRRGQLLRCSTPRKPIDRIQ
jgi:hypothetical protein